MKYIKREIEKTILKANEGFKAVFLGGPRQVGKTTVLKHLSVDKKRAYVTLDEVDKRDLAKRDPDFFLDQLGTPAIIDEVQYAPELFSSIKIRVDSSDKRGLYWITGSQQFNLIKNMQESLAGRVAILDLLGLSRSEKFNQNKDNKKSIFEEIFTGSFPTFFSKKETDRAIFYNSYIQTYLDRDLSDIFGLTKTIEFQRFLTVCAARTGQILNMSDLARDVGVAVSTASEWLSILESTRQIYMLQPYFPNITKRLIKSPKMYFLDTGLATYLTKWDSPKNLEAGSMSGALFETYIISEFIKKYINQGKNPPLYYLRDKEGHEVDLVVEQNGIHLYEIKLAVGTNRAFEANLNYFENKSKKIKSKNVISLIKEPLIMPGNIKYIPYNKLSSIKF